MACWQIGEEDEAWHWYEQADAWMEEQQPEDAELRRFHEEAKALLGL